jgi:hypothetical protein
VAVVALVAMRYRDVPNMMPDREKNNTDSHFLMVLFSMVAADPLYIENAALAQLVLRVNPPFVERL